MLSGQDAASYCAWSPDDSKLLVCGTDNNCFYLWDPMVRESIILCLSCHLFWLEWRIVTYIQWAQGASDRSCLVTRWRTFHFKCMRQIHMFMGRYWYLLYLEKSTDWVVKEHWWRDQESMANTTYTGNESYQGWQTTGDHHLWQVHWDLQHWKL